MRSGVYDRPDLPAHGMLAKAGGQQRAEHPRAREAGRLEPVRQVASVADPRSTAARKAQGQGAELSEGPVVGNA